MSRELSVVCSKLSRITMEHAHNSFLLYIVKQQCQHFTLQYRENNVVVQKVDIGLFFFENIYRVVISTQKSCFQKISVEHYVYWSVASSQAFEIILTEPTHYKPVFQFIMYRHEKSFRKPTYILNPTKLSTIYK